MNKNKLKKRLPLPMSSESLYIIRFLKRQANIGYFAGEVKVTSLKSSYRPTCIESFPHAVLFKEKWF